MDSAPTAFHREDVKSLTFGLGGMRLAGPQLYYKEATGRAVELGVRVASALRDSDTSYALAITTIPGLDSIPLRRLIILNTAVLPKGSGALEGTVSFFVLQILV
jgi:hypothetical protein